MKKIISILLILSTLLLTLSACSSEDADTGSGKSKGTSETTSETTDETAEPTVPKEPDPFDFLADTDLVYGEMYVYDDYSPYLRVDGDLSDIRINRADADKLVDAFMAELLSYYQGIDFVDAPADATVAMRDRATVYYTGYSADPDFTIDEDTLASMTNKDDEEGFGLVIGSNSFIAAYESEEHPENNNPGFEEQLIGAKAGETRTITVTFPDGYLYAPELGGRPIKFDVTIVSIENPDPDEPTEVTDELVEDYTYGEYTTVEALIEFKREDCMTQLAYEAVYNMITVIDYPEAEYNDLLESYMDYYTYDDITEEELAALRESGDKAVKEVMADELIYNFLYAHFEIKLTKAEYLEKLQALYDESAMMLTFYYGIYSAEEMEEYYTRDYLISYFKSELLSEILTEKAVWADEEPADSTEGTSETTPDV